MKISKWLINFASAIFMVTICYLFLCAMSLTSKTYNGQFSAFFNDSSIKNYFFVCLTIILSIILKKYVKLSISDKTAKKTIVIFGLLMSVFILVTQYKPYDDPSVVMNSATQFAMGNYKTWNVGEYGFYYSYQTGIIVILYFLSNLFGGNNYLFMQLINIILLCIAYYLIYRLSEVICKNKKVSYICLLAMCIYLPMSLFVSFIYGTIIGFSLAVSAIYFEMRYIDTDKKRYLFLSGLLIALAYVAKPNYAIYFVAMIIIYLLKVFENHKKFYFAAIVYSLVMLLSISTLVNMYVSLKMGKDVPSGAPFSSFIVMGLSDNGFAPGWHNQISTDLYTNNSFDIDKTNEESIKQIGNIIGNYKNNPGYMVDFFNRKNISQWINPTFECFQVFLGRETEIKVPSHVYKLLTPYSDLNKQVVNLLDIIQSLILAGAILYMLFKFNMISIHESVFMILFMGGFIFHSIAEARCYYTVPYFTLLIPYAVSGFNMCSDFVPTLIHKKNYNISLVIKLVIVGILLFASLFVCRSISNKYECKIDEYNKYYSENDRLMEDGVYSISPFNKKDFKLGIDTFVEGHLKKMEIDKVDIKDDRYLFNIEKLDDMRNNNIYLIWNKYNGNYVSAYNIEEDSPYNGLVLRRMENSPEIKWYVEKAMDDSFYIYYVDCDRHYVEWNMENGKFVIRINKFTGENNQKWYFIKE